MWGVYSPNSSHFKSKMMGGLKMFKSITRNHFEACLKDPQITKIYVCTPTLTHGEIVLKCLEAGKHVLVEKGWWGIEDVWAPLKLADDQGLKLDIAYQPLHVQGRIRAMNLKRRFHSAIAKFMLPMDGIAMEFEDVGFYPVMELLLWCGQNYSFSPLKGMRHLAFASVPTESEPIEWQLQFSTKARKFRQQLVLFHDSGVTNILDPFVSRSDPRRYHEVFRSFERLSGISDTAKVFPTLKRTLQKWAHSE